MFGFNKLVLQKVQEAYEKGFEAGKKSKVEKSDLHHKESYLAACDDIQELEREVERLRGQVEWLIDQLLAERRDNDPNGIWDALAGANKAHAGKKDGKHLCQTESPSGTHEVFFQPWLKEWANEMLAREEEEAVDRQQSEIRAQLERRRAAVLEDYGKGLIK